MNDLSMRIMTHPTAEQFTISEVGDDAWFDIGSGYTCIQLFLGSDGEIAQAIIDALTPYAKGNPA